MALFTHAVSSLIGSTMTSALNSAINGAINSALNETMRNALDNALNSALNLSGNLLDTKQLIAQALQYTPDFAKNNAAGTDSSGNISADAMAGLARRVSLGVNIGGQEVASAISPSLIDLTYTDNAHGKADEIQITLEDREGNWAGKWRPKKGMNVIVSVICYNWEKDGAHLHLPCGSFKIDELEFSGPPDKINIKAVTSALNGPMRDTQKNKAWENTSIRTIVNEIASANGLQAVYMGNDYTFKRKDQRKQSDISFLSDLAEDYGFNCKIHDKKLIFFDAEQAESQSAVLAIPKTGNMYSPTSWSFKESSSKTDYAGAQASYTDPESMMTHRGIAVSGNITASNAANPKVLTLEQRIENAADAMRLSKAKLHKANTEEKTVSIECMGCPKMAAGRTLELQNFGQFSGKYFIAKATHKIGGSGGYTTSLELTATAPTKGVTAMDTL